VKPTVNDNKPKTTKCNDEDVHKVMSCETTHTADCVYDTECCRWYISATKHSCLYLHLRFLWKNSCIR